jgi:glycosyltransferase involved in cell wall biosynthesis
MYILGIDASNIRKGGGVTHLVELLKNSEPEKYGFSKVIVWSNRATLKKIHDRKWLVKSYDEWANKSLLTRAYWQRFRLKKVAKSFGCDLLFVPGGLDASGFKPMVTMHRNLLPFEWRELLRYGLSMRTIKFIILRFLQSISFRRADGVIFLTQYAQDVALKVTGLLKGSVVVIPHGVDPRFFAPPRKQKGINDYDFKKPIRLIYISTVAPYKHQWNVVEAVSALRNDGIPVTLDLFGASCPSALKRLEFSINKVDPCGHYIQYHGLMQHEAIQEVYLKADIVVFASSCETFGQILIEGMSAGLPVACSNASAMPELLGSSGVYFDPLNSDSIAITLERLINSPELRADNALHSFERAKEFSWERCSDDTFKFLRACLTRSID